MLAKLGIEEKHEYLQNSLPFYRKISGAVIPPLQSSLCYIHGGSHENSPGQSDELANPEDYIDAEDGRTDPKKAIDQEDDDTFDVARPLGEDHASNSFLNTLTMANVYAGVGSLKNLKNLLGDISNPSWLDHKGGRLIGYSMFSSSESEDESEDEEEDEVDERDSKYMLQDEKLKLTKSHSSAKSVSSRKSQSPSKDIPTKTSSIAASSTTKASSTTEPTKLETEAPNILDNEDLDMVSGAQPLSNPLVLDHVLSLGSPPTRTDGGFEPTVEPEIPVDNTLGTELLDSSIEIPSETHWKPWHSSVMERLDITPLKEVVLIKFKEKTTTETETEKAARQRLTWLLGLRMKEAFQLDNSDVFHANFDTWLIKDVLLQGQVFLTRDNFCFYSLLPGTTEHNPHQQENPDLALYEGTLGMKAGDSLLSNTHRFWAVLRPETLSLYTSPTDMYFPEKVVDLRNALYCELSKEPVNPTSPPPGSAEGVSSPRLRVPSSRDSFYLSSASMLPSQPDSETSSINEADLEEASEEMLTGVWFKVVCTNKTYRFQTGSLFSARHWYNSITKAIFQLHNCNSRREVLHKIPFDQIMEYQKNFVLADSLPSNGDDNDDNETPVSFSIKYLSPHDHQSSKLKSKVTGSKPSPYETIHFVLFHMGKDFVDLFSRLYEERQAQRQHLHATLNQRMKRRAKKVFQDETSDEEICSVMTTIQPEFASGASLVDKVARVNEHIIQSKFNEQSHSSFASDEELSSTDGNERIRSMARLLGINKQVFSKSENDSSSSSLKVPTSINSAWENANKNGAMMSPLQEDGVILQFPKPFSISTLKNLNMNMITTKRRFADVEKRLIAMNETHKRSYSHSVGDLSFTDSYKDFEESISDVTTEDASSGRGTKEEKQKKSKFKAFKKKLKTVSSMGGVWSANPDHYIKLEDNEKFYVKSADEREVSEKRFKKHFSLNSESKLVATYYCHLKRSIPVYGKLYLGNDKLCFRSLIPGISTKMILPLKDVETCSSESGSNFKYSGLVITILGMESLVLEFGSVKSRDDCLHMVLNQLEILHADESWAPKAHEWGHAGQYRDPLQKEPLDKATGAQLRDTDIALAKAKVRIARLRHLEDRISTASGIEFPLIFEDSLFYYTEVKPAKSYNITLLTIGSRGDVQPYIALGKGLLKEGHTVTIATHSEFKEWIEKHNLKFKEIAGNPAELMSLMVTHGSMSVGFIKEASSKFRNWITDLLDTSWEACQGADLLIESPSAMGGLHIAEALGIAYMRAFTMPWTRTRAYPHAFIVPDSKRGGSYNLLTHVMFENVFWKGISSQVNKWRVEKLGLAKTSLAKMQQYKVPFLYNISPSMFPPSVDFPEWVKVTGYWFLDEGDSSYEPPQELVDFIEGANKNKQKIVYIGFGSIVVNDAKSLTKAVIEAVENLGVRCILNKGWSDRLSKDKGEIEVELPPLIYDCGPVPHDWLFPKVDAAVHHGGSGTTGATLRSGTPTIIKPFFGDQFFYASRVEDLGVGLALKNLNLKSLTKALKLFTRESKYLEKAKAVAHSMEHETGVLSAIDAIYSELAYSKSLMLTVRYNTEERRDDRSGAQTPNIAEEEDYLSVNDEDTTDEDDDDSDISDESDDEFTEDDTVKDRLETVGTNLMDKADKTKNFIFSTKSSDNGEAAKSGD